MSVEMIRAIEKAVRFGVRTSELLAAFLDEPRAWVDRHLVAMVDSGRLTLSDGLFSIS